MPALEERVDVAESEDKKSPWPEQEQWRGAPPTSLELRRAAEAEFIGLLKLVEESAGSGPYDLFEKELLPALWTAARHLVGLFLCRWREKADGAEHTKLEAGQRWQKPKGRWLGTLFGGVFYWRAYVHCQQDGGGYFPLDRKLGLLGDGFSLGVMGRAAELATKMSYEASAAMMRSFILWSPAPSTIEEAVLGLGRHTGQWFEQCAPAESDGEVLVIQIDSKATPTATDAELHKRRGQRSQRPKAPSPRHRGRAKRAAWAPKKRRKKGDKSKNGKMATLVVMYTLRKALDENGKPLLLGPINRWQYASYAPKRHAVAIARREAEKRGFTPDSDRTIQLVTDGDEELERCIDEMFPKALHTLDVAHAVEYLWKAGACLYPEGSDSLSRWVHTQKRRLLQGQAAEVVLDADEAAKRIKSLSRQARFTKAIDYLAKRVDMMNYAELRAEDLELASGIVEGAVRYVISQRFDEGGMRWIRQRAEALLQLRCIQLNGHWQRFLSFAHARLQAESAALQRSVRLLRDKPEPLPTYGLPVKN